MKIELSIDDPTRILAALGAPPEADQEEFMRKAVVAMLQQAVFNYEQKKFQEAFVAPQIGE